MSAMGLNLLQRMSGIATRHAELAGRGSPAQSRGPRRRHAEDAVGMLDKRALHLGGGGTHRLGLWDAILIKNNHLALLASREEEAARMAIERAWPVRAPRGVHRSGSAQPANRRWRRRRRSAGVRESERRAAIARAA